VLFAGQLPWQRRREQRECAGPAPGRPAVKGTGRAPSIPRPQDAPIHPWPHWLPADWLPHRPGQHAALTSFALPMQDGQVQEVAHQVCAVTVPAVPSFGFAVAGSCSNLPVTCC